MQVEEPFGGKVFGAGLTAAGPDDDGRSRIEVGDQADGPIYGIELTNDGLVSFGGGLPITDVRGRVVGAAL